MYKCHSDTYHVGKIVGDKADLLINNCTVKNDFIILSAFPHGSDSKESA